MVCRRGGQIHCDVVSLKWDYLSSAFFLIAIGKYVMSGGFGGVGVIWAFGSIWLVCIRSQAPALGGLGLCDVPVVLFKHVFVL